MAEHGFRGSLHMHGRTRRAVVAHGAPLFGVDYFMAVKLQEGRRELRCDLERCNKEQ